MLKCYLQAVLTKQTRGTAVDRHPIIKECCSRKLFTAVKRTQSDCMAGAHTAHFFAKYPQ